jgi:hypothetical protein
MAPRFLFAILSIAFAVTVLLATATTVRHLNLRAADNTGLARNT